MALPKHKIRESLDARSTDEEVERRVIVPASEGVGSEGGGCYELGRMVAWL